MLPLTLSLGLAWLASVSTLARAGTVEEGGACNVANNRVSPDTKQFSSDCTATTYCNGDGTCHRKGCRKDEYPFGCVIQLFLSRWWLARWRSRLPSESEKMGTNTSSPPPPPSNFRVALYPDTGNTLTSSQIGAQRTSSAPTKRTLAKTCYPWVVCASSTVTVRTLFSAPGVPSRSPPSPAGA